MQPTHADAARRPIGWIAIALALALAMRLFALYLAAGVQHFGDPHNYIQLANALDAGRGLALPGPGHGPWAPTALFPPALPLLLAGVGFVAPLNAVTLTIINSLIDGAAALLLGRLAKQFGRPDLAVPVGLAYLAWPSIAFMASLAYKEGLMIALLLASLVALLEQARRGGRRWAMLSGVTGGLLVLTQPALAPLLPLLFLALRPQFTSNRSWFRACLIAAAITLIVMLPWWARNAMLYDRFIPFTSSGGLSLWEGAHPAGGMVWHFPPAEWARAGEIEAGRLAGAEAWRTIAADPAGYILRCLTKFPRSFFTSNWAIDQLLFAGGQRLPAPAASSWLRIVPTMVELWVVLVAVIGMVRAPRSAAVLLLWGCLAQVLLFSIWFEFSERHRLFLTPFILLLAIRTLADVRAKEPSKTPTLETP